MVLGLMKRSQSAACPSNSVLPRHPGPCVCKQWCHRVPSSSLGLYCTAPFWSSVPKLYPLGSVPRLHFWRFCGSGSLWEPPGVLRGSARDTKVWPSLGLFAKPLPSRSRLSAAAPPPPLGAARKRGSSGAGRGKGRGSAVPGPPGSWGWALRGQPAAPPDLHRQPPGSSGLGA